jgi:glycosyltransferase involved in cell wall biosynthesis
MWVPSGSRVRGNGRGSIHQEQPNALVVRGWPGQSPVDELRQQALAGARPRTLYVELARGLDAVVIDSDYLARHGHAVSRTVARAAGTVEGEVLETFLRRHRYRHIVAWADRIGLELALLLKLARSRRDLVLVSSRLMSRSKRPYLEYLRVQTQIRSIISYSSVQLNLAAERYGLSPDSLHFELQPVDERFWHPMEVAQEDVICSVGCISGLRDYRTLVEAVRGLPVRVELAVGSLVTSAKHRHQRAEQIQEALPPEMLPENVSYRLELPFLELRELYARSRFVVMPLVDVDFDAGVTSITEAMAMGKAVIVTRTKGQVDVIHDGVEGIYVPARNPGALREAICHLLENPAEAERMGAAGRTAVLERHTLGDYVSRLAHLVTETTAS